MDQIELKVNQREILGKKVKALRRKGITPLHVFGSGIDSVAFQCETTVLRRVLAEAGHTQLVNIKAQGEKKPRPAVVAEIQISPRSGELLHVDFHQVNMEQKIRVEVPLVLVGEAPALKNKENMLAQELNSIEVECLPNNIPTSVEVDVTNLLDTDSALRVKDLELDSEVTVLNDSEALVARITIRAAAREEIFGAGEAGAEAGGETPVEAGAPAEKAPASEE